MPQYNRPYAVAQHEECRHDGMQQYRYTKSNVPVRDRDSISRKSALRYESDTYIVILDPKSGDAGSASPGVGKRLRTVQRERDDLTTSTRLAIDPKARKSRKRLGKN